MTYETVKMKTNRCFTFCIFFMISFSIFQFNFCLFNYWGAMLSNFVDKTYRTTTISGVQTKHGMKKNKIVSSILESLDSKKRKSEIH